MTLSAATAIGFAVAGGAPADARQWITFDLAGFPGSDRRGYIVATEPLLRSWHGIDLANQAREIILTELRRLRHLPPDEALGRSLAAANGIVLSRNHEAAQSGLVEDVSLVGVSAVVFEDNVATIAHVPPGQLILIEDGLVYTVPEFRSWFPDFAQDTDGPAAAEPLGYASWTAPLMAQSEVRAGDTVILCTADLGRAFVEDAVASGYSERDLVWLHRRDPDDVLNVLKEVVIDTELPSAAAAVLSFPPLPSVAEIRTLGDVRLRAGDTIRHAVAGVRQVLPSGNERVSRNPVIPGDGSDLPAPVAEVPQVAEGQRLRVGRSGPDLQDRLQRVFEPKRDSKAQWQRRSQVAEFGVPGSHGVNVYRNQSGYASESGWRHRLPRLPIIGSSWIWPLMFLAAIGLVLGALWMRQELLGTDVPPEDVLASIDQEIVAAREADASSDVLSALNAAQEEIDRAEEIGLDPALIEPRQQTVTEMMDAETNVIRMSDVQRIGSLPDELEASIIQGVNTPAGVFFVAGDLYQYLPNEEGQTPELVKILAEGDKIGNVAVGGLWGVAFDARGLYVTDGDSVFMLPIESQEWRAVSLGRINNQAWTPGPLAAFDGSIYLLQAEYRQIYRFSVASSENTAQPVDWLLTGARDSADDATDIAIDGNIYMLIDDGTMQLLRLGDLQSSVRPEYVGDDRAVSLVGREGTGYLYEMVLSEDVEDARIVAFDLSGENAVQLRLPIGFSTGDANVAAPFDGVQEIIVEESTGTIYIFNSDGIWTARYSLPELPADSVTEDEPVTTPTEQPVASPSANSSS
ncbi:MAG TPA: hypothetical protein VEW66_03125 [Thermomicrobiales bacterium]|nr:hypothetical protein [Thermomicrobiales bacterium]